MKTCVLYVSHTGNTKRLAEALSELLKAPLLNVTTASSSDVAEFDLLVIGTPVIGFNPAPEVLSFVNSLPMVEGKKTVIFCTYAFAKGGTLRALGKKLAGKGYATIFGVGKRGVKPSKADFQDVLAEVSGVVEEEKRRTEHH
jgi:flavodoxin